MSDILVPMKFRRRDVLKGFGGTTLAALVHPVFAKARPLTVLILGGTGFIGPHFVDALTAGGHRISLFNRGKRDPDMREGVEQLLGDRDGQIDSLKGRDWDVVIDNSGYKPSQVRLTAEPLDGHIQAVHLHLEHRRLHQFRQGRHRRGLRARHAQGTPPMRP